MAAAPSPQVSEPTAPRSAVRRWLSRAVALVYGLVMFEVVIMLSPFAFYFYAAYGPTLKWLNHSRATAWLTGFMLPHAVFTTSPFLEFLRWDFGRYAFGLGLVAFFLLAVQIYGSKLFGRKIVTGGAYRYIRHPQYLCLAMSAFGLLTMWPRMVIFLLFVGMLFAYYFLARVEERRTILMYPGYEEYMRRTACSCRVIPADACIGSYSEIYAISDLVISGRLACRLYCFSLPASGYAPTLCGTSQPRRFQTQSGR